MPLAEVLEEFPSEQRLPLVRLVDELKAEFVVRRADFEDLKAIVRDLAKSQQELAEAQKRTEELPFLRLEELKQGVTLQQQARRRSARKVSSPSSRRSRRR